MVCDAFPPIWKICINKSCNRVGAGRPTPSRALRVSPYHQPLDRARSRSSAPPKFTDVLVSFLICFNPLRSRSPFFMRLLVTGSAGFIGFHLTKRLLDEGDEVFGVDELNNYYDPKLKQDRLAQLQRRSGFH